MKKVLIVLGSGGVGKTTSAAALGLALAKNQKGALFTIDPSKRLCQTLGLEKLSLEPQHLCENRLEAYGLEIQEGLKKLITRIIKDEQRVDKLLKHRLFKIIEGNISHLDHFVAIDKIVELLDRKDLDFIVIDTPPHDQAFEFFESPRVLADFLDKGFLGYLIDTPETSKNIFTAIFSRALEEGWKIFKALFGQSFWDELSLLLKELLPLRERLLYASERMMTLLSSADTEALVVSVPEKMPMSVAQRLSSDWNSKMKLKIKALVLNKCLVDFNDDKMSAAYDEDLARIRESLNSSLFEKKLKLQKEVFAQKWLANIPKTIKLKQLSKDELRLDRLEEVGNEIAREITKEFNSGIANE